MKKKYLFEYNMTFMTIMSFILLIIPCIFVAIYFALTKDIPLNSIDNYFYQAIKGDSITKMVLAYLIAFTLIFIWMIIHEFIHGTFYILKGANKKNITYGAALEKGVFYCRCGEFIKRDNILSSLLAPFTIIGVITLIIGMITHSYLLIALSVFNISGAGGDISMFFFFNKIKDKELKFIEFGDSLTFAVESKEDLTKLNYPGVQFKNIIKDDKELPQNDNSKKIVITKPSYYIFVGIVVTFAILLVLSL